MTNQEIINKALSLGFTEVELFVRTNNTTSLSYFEGKVDALNVKNIIGLSIRGLYNGKMSYVYTEAFETKDLDEMLNKLIENAKNLNSTEEEFIYDGKGVYVDVPLMSADYDDYSLNDKIALLDHLEKACLKKDPRIVKAEVEYSENLIKTQIINSKGMNLEKKEQFYYIYTSVVGLDKDQTTSGFAIDINTSIKEFEEARVILDATNEALNALGAGFVNTGKYPVVLSKEVASDILKAFASLFSGESALKKISTLTDKIDKQIFGENITIYDDPFIDKALMKISFDDEGVPCYTKTIVENGIFKGFLHSQKTANYFHTKPTGNGFKNQVAGSVSVSPTNLFIKEGNLSKDEIIASIGKGLYVTSVKGLHAGLNPISGDFNLQSSGFMIENGKTGQPVTLFVLSGNFFEMMNKVEMIGNDIVKRFDSVASPTLKIKELNISGK